MNWILLAVGGLALMSESANTTTRTASLRVVRIAVCQVHCVDGDAEGNLRRIEYALEDAARQQATLACFPESVILGWVNPDAHRLAEPIPGPITERLAALARRHRIMLCVGLDEKDGEKLYDSAILISAEGELLLKHRKINNLSKAKLMDPPYADGSPDGISVVETAVGRVGLLICADTFVQSHLDRMAGKRPDLLLVPYGWAAQKHEWPQHGASLRDVVVRTAKSVHCPVVGTDCVGMITHGPWAGRTYGGQSVLANGLGRVLGVLRDRDSEVRVFDVTVGRGE